MVLDIDGSNTTYVFATNDTHVVYDNIKVFKLFE